VAGRVLNLNYFQTTIATSSDADGSPHPFSLQMRDETTGPLNENTVARVKLHYDLSGVGTAITATHLDGRQNIGGTRWGSFSWGGANWGAAPPITPLSGQAPEAPLGDDYTWPVVKRVKYARFKFDCAQAASYLTVRAVETHIRSSGRT
jgi:hypothetical protein